MGAPGSGVHADVEIHAKPGKKQWYRVFCKSALWEPHPCVLTIAGLRVPVPVLLHTTVGLLATLLPAFPNRVYWHRAQPSR